MAEQAVEERKNGEITCLIVDDSPVVRVVARRILEGLDYSVREAEDSAAGLQACRENMPDLIFLDINMPKRSGHEVLGWIREQRGLRGLPVVMLTVLAASVPRT